MPTDNPIPAPQEQQLAQRMQRLLDQRQLNLPLLPQRVAEVLRLIGDENADLRRLETLIEADQSLAGHVLRMANSAAYQVAGQPITSLRQATARLGLQQVAQIALAAALGPRLFVAPGFEALAQSLWRDSLATALWARELVLRSGRSGELSFLCGLLHQIGRPVVLREALAAARAGLALDEALLLRLMDRFATPVGIELATHWQLPDPVIATIAALGALEFHSDYDDVVSSVRVARLLTERARLSDELLLDDVADLVRFGVGAAAIEKLLEKQRQVRAVVEILAA